MKISEAAFSDIFGVSRASLRALGIDPETIDDEPCYPLEQVLKRCQRSFAKMLAARLDSQQTMGAETLKKHKLLESARKLKMANDQTEAALVDAESHADDFNTKTEAVEKIIAEIPDLILENCPDIDPAALAIVQAEIEKTATTKKEKSCP